MYNGQTQEQAQDIVNTGGVGVGGAFSWGGGAQNQIPLRAP